MIVCVRRKWYENYDPDFKTTVATENDIVVKFSCIPRRPSTALKCVSYTNV